MLATLLDHALQRNELCRSRVKDFKHEPRAVPHLKVSGKGSRIRCVQMHPAASGLVLDYIEAAGHGAEDGDALFRPRHNNGADRLAKTIRSLQRAYRLKQENRSRPVGRATPLG